MIPLVYLLFGSFALEKQPRNAFAFVDSPVYAQKGESRATGQIRAEEAILTPVLPPELLEAEIQAQKNAKLITDLGIPEMLEARAEIIREGKGYLLPSLQK